ncbi:hypothetical protein K505DRAFT_394690 [Melanomma pulvis-pyrius CBS 109.77]|uniref:RNase MRP protein 1 RNA binding domain-containing protein n=1 Tax=Melanomma pulvis-pyrius CBS 109.77 TaxID=1314802 RepID=A0A6A6XPM3_9PLEO|nr:hypothetical protein K505DRAFT_394690 [Melanomma pulvis-pyrius CBS 109.77]
MAVATTANSKAMPKGPQISSKTLLKANDKDKQALVDIHELFTRLFVRNRNQHRRSNWFKSLTQFRKELGHLVEDMNSGKKAFIAEKIEQRLRYWDERCIHQCSFTQLIAVGPFAVIGLVLMASTARVCRVTGVTDLYEEIGSEDMKTVLKSVDEGTVAELYGGLRAGDQEDEGELIERDE